MSINVSNKENYAGKQIFTPKPPEKNGLILKVHHTHKRNKIRLLHGTFNRAGKLLAISDRNNNIFVIDLHRNKCWGFPTNISISVIKFSDFNDYELVVGTKDGNALIIHVESAEKLVQLSGNTGCIIDICFAHDHLCLTASKREGLIWNLNTFSKLQVLQIEEECYLKYISFIPRKHDILACFKDDTILIWNYPSLECTKHITSASWNKDKIKSVTFSRNGRVMVLGGYFQQLVVFLLEEATLSKFVDLPNHIQTVKKVEFVPQLFDGGANKVLVILSGTGVVYFYDLENYRILYDIHEEQEIIGFNVSPDGAYIACLFCEGHIAIYKVKPLLKDQDSKMLPSKKQTKDFPPKVNAFKLRGTEQAESEIKELLRIDKLKGILKVYRKYPENYRLEIWVKLLQLPKNYKLYNGSISNTLHESFPNLENKYPLINKASLRNLKKLLGDLTTWSPFLKDVQWLPLFIFPFVKVFQNDPVICFEAACTLITNWCQYWFEFFPLPPANVLAMIDNLLLEHDPQLAEHLHLKANSTVYAWTLLESSFSEVLPANDWCILWDHVFTNEPYFLLFCVVAYNVINRESLLAMHSNDEFNVFFHNTNPINIKRFVSKAYKLMESTSEQNHPKRYLYEFVKLEKDCYPKAIEPPEKVLMSGTDAWELANLEKEEEEIGAEEKRLEDIISHTRQKFEEIRKEQTKNELLERLEQIYKKEIKKKRSIVQKRRKELERKRMEMYNEELKLLDVYKETVSKSNNSKAELMVEKMLDEIDRLKGTEEVELARTEANLFESYTELIKRKVGSEIAAEPQLEEQLKVAKLRENLFRDIDQICDKDKRADYYKALRIATSKTVLENLISTIRSELASEMQENGLEEKQHDAKISKLETAARRLEKDIESIINDMSPSKIKSTQNVSNQSQSFPKVTMILKSKENDKKVKKIKKWTNESKNQTPRGSF